jgi:hypothetical protein
MSKESRKRRRRMVEAVIAQTRMVAPREETTAVVHAGTYQSSPEHTRIHRCDLCRTTIYATPEVADGAREAGSKVVYVCQNCSARAGGIDVIARRFLTSDDKGNVDDTASPR